VNFFGVITGSNAGSIVLHEKMGYQKIAVHERTGWKFGRWHDSVWMHKRVYEGEPKAIMPVYALNPEDVARIFEKTEKILEKKVKM